MSTTKSDQENFFTPKSFYSLHSMGLEVWIICLVVSSVFPSLTSFWFRIIALTFSLLASLTIFFTNEQWRKPINALLIILNACLVFVNASGYNAITYNIPFEKLKYRNDSTTNHEARIFDFANQKNWWPDNNLQTKMIAYSAQTSCKKKFRTT